MNKIKSWIIACLFFAITKTEIVAPFIISRTEHDESFIEDDFSADQFTFTTENLPDDPRWLPTLGNGHIGFTVFSDEILMNGLYNGKKGLSHRASIPNFGYLFMSNCSTRKCTYSLDVRRGLFVVQLTADNEYKATHFIYAHRFYTRAVINQVFIQRLAVAGDINLKLNSKKSEGNSSVNEKSDDLNFVRNETIEIDGQHLNLLLGRIKELENGPESFNHQQSADKNQLEEVFVLWNQVPDEITLENGRDSKQFTFAMAIDGEKSLVMQEIMDIFRITGDELLKKHIDQWIVFWDGFQIDGQQKDGNEELVRAIISSVFYLTSSLPSIATNSRQHQFYGLSPTGLGRGNSLTDYEGHSMWDSEMWMLPPIALINPDWAKQLLQYRYMMITAALDNAKDTGYRGARFPWESAATGIEVIQPGYEYIAEYQQHISADISFALKFYTSLTHDKKFLESEGCDLATAITEFWASRVEFNSATNLYDIRHVMGPDEDHSNISNNLYTNVNAKHALNFGWFTKCVCDKSFPNDDWLKIADKITVLYDPEHDYHPQYAGYKIGTEIKQADVILTTYPLMYPFSRYSVLNDLKFYSNVTRDDGPAMSFSMYAISYLDANDELNANKMLTKSYKLYIRQPFNVWSELSDTVKDEIGATNFVTGAGGFLQLMFNGFFGVRVHLKYLEIKNPRLPENYTYFRTKGLSYLNSKFQLEIHPEETILTFYQLADKLSIQLGEKHFAVAENTPYILPANTSCVVTPADDVFRDCDLKNG